MIAALRYVIDGGSGGVGVRDEAGGRTHRVSAKISGIIWLTYYVVNCSSAQSPLECLREFVLFTPCSGR